MGLTRDNEKQVFDKVTGMMTIVLATDWRG